jgi:hypothetical protein
VATDETPVAPVVAAVPVRWLAPSAPWAAQVAATPTASRFVAGLALRGALTYDDRALDGGSLREEWEAVLVPIGAGFDPLALHVVDHDDRDFLPEAPAGARYVLPGLDLGAKGSVEKLRKAVVDHLVAARPLSVSVNKALKLASRPGESAEAFALRCGEAADAAADDDAAVLRTKYEARLRREQDQVTAAAGKVARAESAVNTNRSSELIDGAGSILGSLFGGRKRAGSIAASVSRASDRRRRSAAAEDRLDETRDRLADAQGDIVELEAELAAELTDIVHAWREKAAAIERLDIPLERSDVAVSAACVLWIPMG